MTWRQVALVVVDIVLLVFAVIGLVHVVKHWAKVKHDVKSTARSVSGRVADVFRRQKDAMIHTEREPTSGTFN